MTTANTLLQIKTILSTIATPGVPRVFAYPDDWFDLATGDFRNPIPDLSQAALDAAPAIVVREDFARGSRVAAEAVGKSADTYWVEISLLTHVFSTRPQVEMAAEFAHRRWLHTIADKLLGNMTLNGSVRAIGDSGNRGDFLNPVFKGIVTIPSGHNVIDFLGFSAYLKIRERRNVTMRP